MENQKPRRARSRWLVDAPEYVIDVFDNKKTADRYSVFFGDAPADDGHVLYLGLGDTPDMPNGFSQWASMPKRTFSDFRYREGRHRIRWLDLPENVRAHVIRRATCED